MPTPASSSARLPPSSMAGVRANVSRLETYGCSWQSVPESGNTQRSRLTPRRSAASTEHMMIAAAMSTSLLEFMYLRYGSPMRRLLGRRRADLLGVLASRIHAAGLSAATALNRAHSSLTRTRCSSGSRPAAARIAVSNIG